MTFGLLLNLHFNPRQKNLRFFSDIIFTKPLVRSKKKSNSITIITPLHQHISLSGSWTMGEISLLFHIFCFSFCVYLLSAKDHLTGVLYWWGQTSPIWARFTGFQSGISRKNRPVPEGENKCLNLTLFAKIRPYWAWKTRGAKAL